MYNTKTSKLLLFIWGCFSLTFVLLNLNEFLSYSSSDEFLFRNLSSDLYEVNFARYIVWSLYISSLSIIHVNLPIVINLLLFLISFNIFINSFKPNLVLIILILLIPSLILFSNTVLRDFSLVSLLFILITCFRNISKIKIFALIFILTLIFILRPQFGIILIISIIISKYFKNINPLPYALFTLFIFSILIVNVDYMRELFLDYYYTLNVSDSISLFRFEIFEVTDLEIYLTILFNWIFFWFGVNIYVETSILYIPFFFFEACLYFLLICFSFLLFKKTTYRTNYIYRFCFLIIISSFFFSIFEADWGSVYRHKLFYLPALLFLSNKNLKQR